MRINTITKLMLGSCSILAAATAASAQDNTGEASDAPQASSTDKKEIIVTGTQIRGAKIDDVLPVTRIDEEDIETINPGSGDELFRAIPQAGAVAFNEQNTTGGVNSARGDIASINLRELGTGNTLLLITGLTARSSTG